MTSKRSNALQPQIGVQKASSPWWSEVLVWGSRVHVLLIILGFIILPVVLIGWMRQPFTGAFVENTLVIGNLSRPRYATGEIARLRVDDVLIHLESDRLYTAADLNRALREHKFGEVVTLETRSADGASTYVRIRLRRFTPREIWFYFIVPYIVGLAFLVTGIWVIVAHRQDLAGRALAIFATAMGFAIAGILDVWGTQVLTPLWLYSVGMAGAALGTLVFAFPRQLPQAKHSLWLYLIALGLVGYVLSRLGNWHDPWAYIRARQLLLGFAALMALAFIGALVYWQFKREFPLVRVRARFLLGAFVLSFGPMLGWIFAYLTFPTVHFNTLVFVTLPIFPAGLAYALSSYRVVDADLIARRTVAYGLLGTLVVVGYALLVAGVSLVAGRYIPPNSPILLGFAAFVVALIFNPLYGRLLSLVSTAFARSRAGYIRHLEEYSRRLVDLTDQKAVLGLTRDVLRRALRAEPIHIFLYDEMTGRYQPTPDESGAPTAGISFSKANPLITYLNEEQRLFFFSPDDVPEQLADVEERLLLLNSILFVPLPGQSGLLGFITLGYREGLYGAAELEFLDNLAHQLALAIERVATVSKLRQRVEQLNALTRLAQGANVTVRFDDLLELLYAQTVRLIPVPHFQILLLESEGRVLRRSFVVVGDERDYTQEGKVVTKDEGLTWEVVSKRRVLKVQDYPAACRSSGKFVDIPDATAWMGVPLEAGADVVGVMVLAETKPDAVFASEQEQWVQSVADLAGGVIAKARLLEESRRRTAQLNALNQIANRLSSTLSLNELLNQIMQSAVSLLEAEAGTLFLMDEITGELTFEVVVGPVGEQLTGRRLPPGSGLVWQAINERKPFLVADVREDPRWAGTFDKNTGFETRSLLIVPMVAQDKVLGAIEVLNKRDGSLFGKDDAQLLMALASQAAVALENARLYTMTDKALAEKVEELSVLQRIDRELSATLDLKRAMQVTLEWATRRTNSTAGLIGLLEDNRQMRVIASYGYSGEEFERFKEGKLPIGECPGAQRALRTRQPVVLNVPQDGETPALSKNARSMLVVPIEQEGKVSGLLLLESEREHAYTQEMLNFLNRLLDHASIAIANARLYEEVQRANQTKSEFISFVAHELKTPMTSIRGYSDLLAKGAVGELNEPQKNFLNTIRSNVNRMKRLVDDLLEISRLEAGRLELELERVDLHDVMAEIEDTFRGQIEAKQQTLITDIPDDLPLLWADRMRLSQILTNLVSNAHKYTPEGGRIEVIAREAFNEWDAEGPERVVHIMVRDNGLGMSEEDQRKVFQKFFRSEDERARQAPGTGLGLHLTKYLVEMHGGRIWFESKLNVGTTFHFTIPVAEE